MPLPSVLPIPPDLDELRLPAPLEAQDASYLAASARIASLRTVSMLRACLKPVSARETRVVDS
jgi:hypothetical protein